MLLCARSSFGNSDKALSASIAFWDADILSRRSQLASSHSFHRAFHCTQGPRPLAQGSLGNAGSPLAVRLVEDARHFAVAEVCVTRIRNR